MVQICTMIHVNLESQIPSLFPTHLGGGVDGPESVVGQRVELRARVEGPREGEPGGGVGLDGAVDGGDLAVRHAVHHLLVVGAHRLVWGKKKKRDAFQGSVATYGYGETLSRGNIQGQEFRTCVCAINLA